MKFTRMTSHRLFHLVWLLAGVALPTQVAGATPAPETRIALFAAG